MPFYAHLIRNAVLGFCVFLMAARLRADEGVSRARRYVADGEVRGLYVGDDGTMMCVSGGASILRIGKDQETLWNRPLSGKPVLVSPLRDGVILVATETGRAEGYNILGDRVIDFLLPWKPKSREEKASSSLLSLGETAEGWIYLCTADGDFAVFSLKGVMLSRWKTSAAPACPPVIFQGKIVFALEDGSLASYSPSGRPAWNIPAASPALRLLVNRFTLTLAVSRTDGSFEVYAAGNPKESPDGKKSPDGTEMRRITELTLPFESAYILPLASGGFVLVGNDGRVCAISAEGLAGENFFLKDGRPSGALTDGEEALFFSETRGRLSSYSLAGSPLWTTDLTGKPGTPVLSPSSRYLAVGCADWVVQRFEFVRYGGRQASPPAAAQPEAFAFAADPSVSPYRGEYDFIYFMDRASSADAAKQKESLDICAGRIAQGNLGRSLDYIRGILRYQAAGSNSRKYPDVQSRALELLGRIGGSENAYFLSTFLKREKDEYLVLAALASMGAQRSDPDGIMRQGIQDFIFSRGPLTSRLVSAVINALEELSLYSGSLGPHGRAVLLRLLESSSPAAGRRIHSLLTTRP